MLLNFAECFSLSYEKAHGDGDDDDAVAIRCGNVPSGDHGWLRDESKVRMVMSKVDHEDREESLHSQDQNSRLMEGESLDCLHQDLDFAFSILFDDSEKI